MKRYGTYLMFLALGERFHRWWLKPDVFVTERHKITDRDQPPICTIYWMKEWLDWSFFPPNPSCPTWKKNLNLKSLFLIVFILNLSRNQRSYYDIKKGIQFLSRQIHFLKEMLTCSIEDIRRDTFFIKRFSRYRF